MENWEERLAGVLVGYRHKFTLREELENFISQELEKAREEGKRNWREGLTFSLKEVEKAREEGYEEGLEEGLKQGYEEGLKAGRNMFHDTKDEVLDELSLENK